MPAAANTNRSARATWQLNLGIKRATAEVQTNCVTSSADPFARVLGEVVESAEPVVEPVVGPAVGEVVGEVNGGGLGSCNMISL